MKYLFKLTLTLLLVAGLTACNDYLAPTTPQNKPIESVDNVDDLKGLIFGAYSRLSQVPLYGRNWIIYNDVRTGNAFSNGSSGRFEDFAVFQYTVGSEYAEDTWEAAYEVIANCNVILNSQIVTDDTSDEERFQVEQVKGQAYALRAYTHMMLLLLYGQQFVEGSNLGIPYVTTFGDETKFTPGRETVEVSWDKIGQDFQQAIDLLDPSVTTLPYVIIDYYGARALQMRYFLYSEQYQQASDAALDIINSGIWSLIGANEYLAAWGTDGEPQFIFGVSMTQTDNRGINGVSYIVLPNTGYGDVEITDELYFLFGQDDVRKGLYSAIQDNQRIKYRVTGKYPSRFIDIPVIRYAEVILTYAEAQFRLGDAATALEFLNKIPLHRDADPYAVATLDNILLERRKELAMEGHFYWDLLRTGQSIRRAKMRPLVSTQEVVVSFGNYHLALPIPDEEILANPNIEQNVGYTGLSQ